MADRKEVSTVEKILNLQALILIATTLGLFWYGGWNKAMSLGLGGLVAVLPNLHFAYRMHRVNGKDAKQIVQSFYVAEMMKILLTAALFFSVLHIPGVELLTLLAGYIAVASAHWFALILWRND